MNRIIVLFIILVLIHCAALCPNGWIQHDESCYHFSRDNKSWVDAWKFCEIFQSELARIDSKSEEIFIKAELHNKSGNNKYWLGGTDIMLEGEWVWAKTMTRLSEGYTDWHPGEPNNVGNQHCLAIRKDYGYQWTDDNCAGLEGYICEQAEQLQLRVTEFILCGSFPIKRSS